MRVFLLEAGGDPRAARRAPARRLRRAGLPRLRLRERGDELGLLRAPLRRRGAAGARPEVRRGGGGVLYPRAGDARRLHRAQRHDLHAAARLPTGTTSRAAHRRPVLARGAHAALLRARGGLPPPAGAGARCASSASTRPATAGAAGCSTEKSIPLSVLGDDGLVRVLRDTAERLHEQPADAACSAPCAGCAAAWATPTTAACGRGSSRASATRRSPPREHRRAGARERLLDVAARHPRPPAARARRAGHPRALRRRRRGRAASST